MSGPDEERVAELRRQGLERAGFPPELAAAVARDPAVDYQQVLGFVRQGFPPEVAAELARSGQRPVF